jgi:hypothetical protein
MILNDINSLINEGFFGPSKPPINLKSKQYLSHKDFKKDGDLYEAKVKLPIISKKKIWIHLWDFEGSLSDLSSIIHQINSDIDNMVKNSRSILKGVIDSVTNDFKDLGPDSVVDWCKNVPVEKRYIDMYFDGISISDTGEINELHFYAPKCGADHAFSTEWEVGQKKIDQVSMNG